MVKARKGKAPEGPKQPAERSVASGSMTASRPGKRKRVIPPPPQLNADVMFVGHATGGGAEEVEEEGEEEDAGKAKKKSSPSSALDDFPAFDAAQPVAGPSRAGRGTTPHVPGAYEVEHPNVAEESLLRDIGMPAPVPLPLGAQEEMQRRLHWEKDASVLDIDDNAGPDQDLECVFSDDMGLGKTVQAIALMAVNPPDLEAEDQRDDRRKATLIVAPAALLDQWRDEIETKADMFRVFIHHGPKKAKTLAALRKYDVVITSYHTLHNEHNPRTNRDTNGPLAQTKWYRVILDEAQIVRTRSAQISISVAKLDSTYRWCLTGTPFTNGLNDLYPLLRFARLRPWNDWQTFAAHIGSQQIKNAEVAAGKMAAIVKKHLLRRKKTDELEGKPILQLKKKTIDIEFVNFTPEELRGSRKEAADDDYEIPSSRDVVEKLPVYSGDDSSLAASVLLIAYAANGIVDENAERVLGAPPGVDDEEGDDGSEAISDIATATKVMGAELLKEKFRTRTKEKLAKPPQDDADEDENGNGEDDPDCPICFDIMTNARLTMCGHQFCRDCIEGLFNQQIEYANDDGGAAARPCPSCRQNVRLNQLFKSSLFEPSAEDIKNMKGDLEKDKDKGKKKEMSINDLTLENSDDELPSADELFNPTKKPKMEKEKKKKIKKERTNRGIASIVRPFVYGIIAQVVLLKGARVLQSDGSDRREIDLTLDDEVVYTSSKKTKRRVINIKGKGKQRDIFLDSSDVHTSDHDDSDDDSEEEAKAFRPSMLDGLRDFESSAKMQRMVDLLKQWMDDEPEDKVIIFSQWTMCLDLLEGALQRDEIRCMRYDGSMHRQDRSEQVQHHPYDASLYADRAILCHYRSAIKCFKKKGSANIMLISTKCGSVGLNLTEANRVINFDPAWNFASESQAYDRVHRIGQQKEVIVKRLIVKDSIEERILRIQGGKQDLVDAALGEGKPGRLQRLRVGDILKVRVSLLTVAETRLTAKILKLFGMK
ncbi:hypothetical protein FRB96_008218 [Tulasnella sp. 330]|nr:hypothetical protein FRB96_008218 [Tulasnella sp. 330]